ncbi:MAG: YlxR family protein [Anaerolineales bacterium]|jgi:hypothetical protein
MSPKSKRRGRHIPQRTCVGCRQVEGKRTLIRIVRGPEGVEVDLSGKAPGRGAYVHADPDCWAAARKSSLSHALKVKISDRELQNLDQAMKTMFDEQND